MNLKNISQNQPLLLTPGPVLLHKDIQKSLSLPMIHHRSSDFKELLKQASKQLKAFFQTDQPVLILTSTGTGAMEAGFINTLSPQEEVICVGGGKFGERWRDMAQKFSLKTHFIDTAWGEAVSVSQIEEKLLAQPEVKALVVTACETSTGACHPIEEISHLLKKHPKVLFIVDAITGLGAMPLPMDEWGIDVMTAGSQKTFWLPTGLSFICLSKKAWDRSSQSTLPKYYFELHREKKAQAAGQTAFSSSVSLIRALSVSLNILNEWGLEQMISRSEIFKNSCLAFCKALNLQPYSSSPANSLTAVKLNQAQELKKKLEQNHHVIIAGGQGQLKDKLIRIGHLGPLKSELFLFALKALAEELNKRDPFSFSREKTLLALNKAQALFSPDFDIP